MVKEELLKELNFHKIGEFNSYTLDISVIHNEYKQLKLYINEERDFLYITNGKIDANRDGDQSICIYDSFHHGRLTAKDLKQIVKLLK